MEPEAVLGLAGANLAACLTPGQNTALVTLTAARCGLAGGLWAILGILIAEAIWTAIAFLAIAGAVSFHQDAHGFLEFGCGLVLAFFGLSLLAATETPSVSPASRSPAGRRLPRLVLGGLLVGLANPMALLFFVAMLPLFVSATDVSMLATATGVVCLTSAMALAPFLVVSSPLMPRLAQTLMQRAGSVTLIAAGVLFASGMMR